MSGVSEQIKMLEEQLPKAVPGSPEQERIVDSLNKLYKVQLEEQRDNASFEEMGNKLDNMEEELKLKKKQTILQAANVGLSALGHAITVIATVGMFNKELYFGETGIPNVRSFKDSLSTFRSIIPKKH